MVRLIALVACVAITGCAQVQVRPLAAGEEKTAEGVRFYRSWPYLLVTANTTKEGTTYTNEIVYLPKMDEAYLVNVKTGWGTADGSVKLEHGWMLTELGAVVDSQGPETITAATGLLTAVAGIASEGGRQPGLYRIEFDAGHAVRLVGPLKITPASS